MVDITTKSGQLELAKFVGAKGVIIEQENVIQFTPEQLATFCDIFKVEVYSVLLEKAASNDKR